MEINGDDTFVLDVDKTLIAKVELAISLLELTEEYQNTPREEISAEIMRCLFEWWVECEYAPLSNLVDVLLEHSHDQSVEVNVGIIEEIAKLEGRDYLLTRRAVAFFKNYLDNEREQVSFYDIKLPTTGWVISVTIGRESL